MPKSGEPATHQFGKITGDCRDKEAERKIAAKAAAHIFRPGNVVNHRTVDPNDYETWERQRLERKRRNHTLNPYR